jgi:hypothetical protein
MTERDRDSSVSIPAHFAILVLFPHRETCSLTREQTKRHRQLICLRQVMSQRPLICISFSRYLQACKSIPLRWCARSCQQPHLHGHIYGYVDASFADIKPEGLSSMGYVFIINNDAVCLRSTRTPLVTLSAAESEVVALSAATQEAVYLRKLANELGFTLTSPALTTLYEDCTTACALSKENRFRNRSKHIGSLMVLGL